LTEMGENLSLYVDKLLFLLFSCQFAVGFFLTAQFYLRRLYASWKLSPFWKKFLINFAREKPFNWGQQKLVSICTRYTQTHKKIAGHYDFRRLNNYCCGTLESLPNKNYFTEYNKNWSATVPDSKKQTEKKTQLAVMSGTMQLSYQK
jgi:hypothetical protein